MGGFLGRNSLNKGIFHKHEWVIQIFGRFSINIGGLSKNWRKIAKNGPFSAKFIIIVGMKARASFGK